jgi:hypothetical protein
MIFGEGLIPAVLSGQKTETRRPVKNGRPCRYIVGRTYAVQPGRTKEGVGRIKVLEVRRERLSEIDEAAASREGFATKTDFLTYWWTLYGSSDPSTEVWVIRFEPAAEEKPPERKLGRWPGPDRNSWRKKRSGYRKREKPSEGQA